MLFTNSRIIILALLLPVFLYLSLYTWNWKTGHLDLVADYTGLEFTGWVLAPGKWLQDQVQSFWSRYIDLRQVQEENEKLLNELSGLKIRLNQLESQAAEAKRLRTLLKLPAIPDWEYEAARIIAHRIGPNSILRTFMINKGSQQGVQQDMPVITPDGVVGRVFRLSPNYATVLLLTDPNSHIPVLSKTSRKNAIIKGQGADKPLQVKYIARNAPLFSRETLLTSGLAGIFPKGLPIAKIESIALSELSLFQQVAAAPLVDLMNLEEVLLLKQAQKVPD